MRINSKEELQSKKAEIEQNIQNFTCRVLVCSGTGCMASGAQKIYDEMVRLCEGIDGVEIEMQKDIPHVGVIKTGCQGLCELGPLVRLNHTDISMYMFRRRTAWRSWSELYALDIL